MAAQRGADRVIDEHMRLVRGAQVVVRGRRADPRPDTSESQVYPAHRNDAVASTHCRVHFLDGAALVEPARFSVLVELLAESEGQLLGLRVELRVADKKIAFVGATARSVAAAGGTDASSGPR